jgi:hypothetical protein
MVKEKKEEIMHIPLCSCKQRKMKKSTPLFLWCHAFPLTKEGSAAQNSMKWTTIKGSGLSNLIMVINTMMLCKFK